MKKVIIFTIFILFSITFASGDFSNLQKLDTPTDVGNLMTGLKEFQNDPYRSVRYDSGWFAIASGTAYTKTHNLGSNPRMYFVEVSANSDGRNSYVPSPFDPAGAVGIMLTSKNSISVVLTTGSSGWGTTVAGGTATSGFCRLVLIK